MSYSRWISSEFYTFWSGSGATKKEDEEFCCMFSLDSAPHFSYNEVKDMIKNPEIMRHKITDDLLPEHLEELKVMKQFIRDVVRILTEISELRGMCGCLSH